MPTPSKNLQKYAELVPLVGKEVNLILLSSLKVRSGLEKMHEMSLKEQLDFLQGQLDSIVQSANRLAELNVRQDTLIKKESSTVGQALLFAQDELNGLHTEKELNVNTSLYNHAPRLCAKVGYEEALKRLQRLSPTGDHRDKVSDRAFCYCFGFEGSECHFVEFWRDAKPKGGGKELKTNGHLQYSVPFTGYYWYQCEKFLRAYYETYYVAQLKGKVKAISTRNEGKIVEFC